MSAPRRVNPRGIVLTQSGSFLRQSLRFVLPLLIVLCVAPASVAWAQTAPLTPQEIADFNARLGTVVAMEGTLDSTISCLADEEAASVATSEALQLRLGQLRRDEDGLKIELTKFEAEASGFEGLLRASENEYAVLKRQLETVESKRRALRASINACKDEWWTINILCDLAGELAKLDAQFSNLDGNARAVRTRADGSRQRLETARRNFEAARRNFDAAQAAMASATADIKTAEAQIKLIKANLAGLRASRQSFLLARDGFAEALASAQRVETASERSSAARRLRREADTLAEIETSTASLMRAEGIEMPDGARICPAL